MITVTGDDGDSGGDDKISKICSGGHSPPMTLTTETLLKRTFPCFFPHCLSKCLLLSGK